MKVPARIRKLITILITTQFRYVLIAVGFIVAVTGYLVVLRPQFEIVQRVGILAFQTESERLRDRQAYLERVTKMVDAYRVVVSQQQVKNEDIIPLAPEIGELYLTLKALTADAGMTLDSVVVSKGSSLASSAPSGDATTRRGGTVGAQERFQTTGTVQILNVTVTVSGTPGYESFKKIVRDFERSQRLFDVVSLSYQPFAGTGATQAEQGAGASLQPLSFEVKTYYIEQAPQSS